MVFDPWLLGYTAHAGRLSVHYPKRAPDGSVTYGAGLAFDHAPELARNPDGERAVLWRELLSIQERRDNDNR
jgi:hypothetical protein